MRIRIATGAVSGGTRVQPDVTDTEIDAGIMIPWVEIDGHRFDRCVGATVEVGGAGDGDDRATLVILRFIAGAEMVLLDRDGNELR